MGEVVACLRVERKVAAVVGDDGTWPIHWDCRVKDPTLYPPTSCESSSFAGSLPVAAVDALFLDLHMLEKW